MTTVTSYDMFEEFFDFIKLPTTDKEATIKEFGGSNFYIPSYKTTMRNEKIIEKYKSGTSVKILSREYDLTERQIYDITKELRTPSLF